MRGTNVSSALESLGDVDVPVASCGCIPASSTTVPERQDGGGPKSREVTRSDRIGVDSCAGAGRLFLDTSDGEAAGEAGWEGTSNDGAAG